MKGPYGKTALLAFIGLLCLILSIETTEGHKCFVCAPDLPKRTNHHELKNMFGSIRIPKCSHFQSSRKSEYIQNCPKETMGCITQFEDGSVMRTCAKLKVPVDDCKTANDVTYCYCKRELCNNPSQKLDKPGSGIGSNHNPHGLQIQSIDPSKDTTYDDDDVGSGDYYYDEFNLDQEPDSQDYEEDGITEPPLFITEESYKRPTKTPQPPKNSWTNDDNNANTNNANNNDDDFEIFETSIQIEEKYQNSHNNKAKSSNVDSKTNRAPSSVHCSMILIVFNLIMFCL